MSRAERLLTLMQTLRRHRYPVAGAELAKALDISLRTLYRDIASLQAQGAHIDGAAGVGYLLRPGFLLPPLMLSEEEIEALLLGTRWVAERTDSQLAAAARDAMAKIGAVLPVELRRELDAPLLLLGPSEAVTSNDADMIRMRQAIRAEKKITIDYLDLKGRATCRTIWPFALGFFDTVRILAAWCELREEIRSFRIDRMTSLTVLEQRYPKRRQALLKEWRKLKEAESAGAGPAARPRT